MTDKIKKQVEASSPGARVVSQNLRQPGNPRVKAVGDLSIDRERMQTHYMNLLLRRGVSRKSLRLHGVVFSRTGEPIVLDELGWEILLGLGNWLRETHRSTGVPIPLSFACRCPVRWGPGTVSLDERCQRHWDWGVPGSVVYLGPVSPSHSIETSERIETANDWTRAIHEREKATLRLGYNARLSLSNQILANLRMTLGEDWVTFKRETGGVE